MLQLSARLVISVTKVTFLKSLLFLQENQIKSGAEGGLVSGLMSNMVRDSRCKSKYIGKEKIGVQLLGCA